MTEKRQNQSESSGLSAKQKQALSVFATTPTVTKACEKLGITRDCYRRWIKQPEFRDALEKLREDIVCEAVACVKTSLMKAALTLNNLLDREDSPNVQRAASSDLLNFHLKYKEVMEMERRITALEEAVKQGAKK